MVKFRELLKESCWLYERWGTITAQAYVDHVFWSVILSFVEEMHTKSNATGFIFMDDNVPAHTAKITKNFKKQHFILSLDWSSSSSDLNLIENIWSLLKNWLGACDSLSKSRSEIRQAVIEEWDKITVKEIQKYVNSMLKWILKVVEKNGDHTHW